MQQRHPGWLQEHGSLMPADVMMYFGMSKNSGAQLKAFIMVKIIRRRENTHATFTLYYPIDTPPVGN